ncbi:restriction endonuclease subunit S [Vibrio vulnificus]|uniref:restriction endonuclease subunit S n=1 Tax=Vibrio vulnificus TaxID=672 RepID=UPI0018EF0814|nr:restriction endonuclease subunit S [Vibrio vulnificus]
MSQFNVKRVPKDSVLLSFKLTLGRVAIARSELTTNEAIAHFVNPKFGLNKEFLYSYLSTFDYDRLGSTSSIATAVNSKIIKRMPILVPTESASTAFEYQVGQLFEKMKLIDSEVTTLTELRDTLLPRLISGELRLDEVEAAVEQETVSA